MLAVSSESARPGPYLDYTFLEFGEDPLFLETSERVVRGGAWAEGFVGRVRGCASVDGRL